MQRGRFSTANAAALAPLPPSWAQCAKWICRQTWHLSLRLPLMLLPLSLQRWWWWWCNRQHAHQVTEQKLRIRRIVLLVVASAKITSNVEHVLQWPLCSTPSSFCRVTWKRRWQRRAEGEREAGKRRQVYWGKRERGKFIEGKECEAGLFIDQQLAKNELRNLYVSSRESAWDALTPLHSCCPY